VRQDAVVDAFIRSAGELKLGDGLDETGTLYPGVNPVQEKRIRATIERGVTEGARLRLDGRSQTVRHRPRGCFLGPISGRRRDRSFTGMPRSPRGASYEQRDAPLTLGKPGGD
jgi:acyl-CoA reductase-like NAD-dependent aldehyde dehydrogenase